MRLGRKLWIRTLTFVAGEVVPFFWTMRNFIHHNPLHELEHLPFEKAVEEGERVFGGRGFLRRRDYRRLYEKGVISHDALIASVRRFIREEGIQLDPDLAYEFILRTLTSENSPRPYSNLYLLRNTSKPPRPLIDHFIEDPAEVVREFVDSVGKRITFPEAFEVFSEEPVTAHIEEELARGVFAFLDEGNATASMPGREKGLYRTWGEVFMGGKVPEEPEEAIEQVLRELSIPETRWKDYISLELGRSKGIAGYIRWRSSNRDYYWQSLYPADIVDLTAVKLLVIREVLRSHLKAHQEFRDLQSMRNYVQKDPQECYRKVEFFKKEAPLELVERCGEDLKDYVSSKAEIRARNFMIFLSEVLGPKTQVLSSDVLIELANLDEELERREGMIWLRALEESLAGDLLRKISFSPPEETLPEAQFLFCIDVRSERIRKAIEEQGNYETYGIAGFFGIPMAFVELRRGHEEYLCPVLIRPRNVVLELPEEGKSMGESTLHLFEKILHDLKANVLTPFITVEAIGFLFGFDFLGKTFLPSLYGPLREFVLSDRVKAKIRVDKLTEEEIETVLRRLKPDEEQKPYLREQLTFIGFSREEQANMVAKALQSIGLTGRFAPYIFVIGHESRSDNNPYESALDCGACGGASGIYNARVFCMMANDLGVRQVLRDRYHIEVPDETVFIPGVHNTTTDRITFYDLPPLTSDLERIFKEIDWASESTARERAVDLEDKKVLQRAYDWSQVRPEWGLSGNYAFVIGPRWLTKEFPFKGKVFLHSYNWEIDRRGFLLETILSGPLIVGQWINMEHYFSTVDNEVYGSSSKVYHNVVGRFGVMTGNLSDLRTGLPYQTLWRRDEPYHYPIRLITLIYAPFEFARSVIERVYQVRNLVENRWINAFIIDPQTGKVWRFIEGEWRELDIKEVALWES